MRPAEARPVKKLRSACGVPSESVFWPEGEKDVESVGKRGGCAITFGGVGDGLRSPERHDFAGNVLGHVPACVFDGIKLDHLHQVGELAGRDVADRRNVVQVGSVALGEIVAGAVARHHQVNHSIGDQMLVGECDCKHSSAVRGNRCFGHRGLPSESVLDTKWIMMNDPKSVKQLL
ncbi:hypothetical protein OZ411_18305 [Bradyrhizobium sp. Arg237L]|uniref:hypothetical protein n=1 Tax=Bradyrhizobium sp. Arg237L TaxID=3003352 RepID=UPI00249EEC1B|nr:hypothetical protein [Bradyrhizobium sp. Arg237L]MDI4234759.1 hypothetical protein [Bradyrhizobium sp. Arg237L]